MIDSIKKKICILMNKEYSIKLYIFSTLCLTVAAIFQIGPFKNVVLGLYNWHIKQPETIQGGIEILVVFALFIFTILFLENIKYQLIIIMILSCMYLRLHQSLVPALTALIYFEIIISFGAWLLKIMNVENSNDLSTYFKRFIVGLSGWTLLALALSLIGFGTFRDLRILTLVTGILSITKGINVPLSVKLGSAILNSNEKEKILESFLLILILIQFAKSNRAIDYDSIWYGLRPEYVLIGEHSFFDNLGLLQFVHYYPKLMELFYIPISNLGDYSFIYAGNIIMLLLLFLLIIDFSKQLGGRKIEALYITSLLGSLPVVSNMASTAKTDIFTTFLIVLGAYYFFRWIRSDEAKYIYFGVVSFILSFGGKMTSYLYVPLLLLGIFISVFIYFNKSRNEYKLHKINNILRSLKDKKNVPYIIITLISFVDILGITYRTYILTGYPIYYKFGGIWSKMGLNANYPLRVDFAERRSHFTMNTIETLHHWYKLLFNPKDYTSHYVINWPGNITIYLFVVIFVSLLLFENKNRINRYVLIFISCIPVILAQIFYVTRMPHGGDGNYYLAPIILVSLCLFSIITNLHFKIKVIIYSSLIIFLPLQFSLMFVSHSSWSWGTEKFSLDFTKPIIDSRDRVNKEFEYKGILEIERYLLHNREKDIRAIGFGDTQMLNKLSCRYEDIYNSTWMSDGVFSTEQSIIEYLKWGKIYYLISPREKVDGYDVVSNVFQLFESNAKTKKIESEKYYLLDISESIKAINSL